MTYRSRSFSLCAGVILLVTSGCVSPYVYLGDDCGGGAASFSGRYGGDECGGCADCDWTDCNWADCGSCEDHTLTGTLRRNAICGSGCGELYLGEWSYDPPDDCDPCGNHGDWIGAQCCPPSAWSWLGSGILGQRGDSHGGACGCDECVEEFGDSYETGSSYYEGDTFNHDGLQEPGIETIQPGTPVPTGPLPSVRVPISTDGLPLSADRRNSARNPQSRLLRRQER